mmetsp:Transcript_8751/g.19219  ORF Transcript_8751/g.19219 Transcript_8751/m.19219 type:complete len:220 (-) Transcript_8751:1219-1878(-)
MSGGSSAKTDSSTVRFQTAESAWKPAAGAPGGAKADAFVSSASVSRSMRTSELPAMEELGFWRLAGDGASPVPEVDPLAAKSASLMPEVDPLAGTTASAASEVDRGASSATQLSGLWAVSAGLAPKKRERGCEAWRACMLLRESPRLVTPRPRSRPVEDIHRLKHMFAVLAICSTVPSVPREIGICLDATLLESAVPAPKPMETEIFVGALPCLSTCDL